MIMIEQQSVILRTRTNIGKFTVLENKKVVLLTECRQLYNEVLIKVIDNVDMGLDQADIGSDSIADIQEVAFVGDVYRDAEVGLLALDAFEQRLGCWIGLLGSSCAVGLKRDA